MPQERDQISQGGVAYGLGLSRRDKLGLIGSVVGVVLLGWLALSGSDIRMTSDVMLIVIPVAVIASSVLSVVRG